MKALVGKNIVITGGSRGLGRSIAKATCEAGANILLVARSEESLDVVRQELQPLLASNQDIYLLKADLSKPDGAETVLQGARSRWSTLHGIVNNAGVQGPIGPAWENAWPDWTRTIQVNLLSPVNICRLAIPWMAAGGGGSIVNLSGGGATGSRPFFSAYAAAKTALVRFTEILADEAHEKNVRVNSIAPGALNTEMLKEVLSAGPENAGCKEYEGALKQAENGGADPQKAAALCVFLMSEASTGITGKLISALWDPWLGLPSHIQDLSGTDIYTLRRVVPKDRGKGWG